MDKPGGKAGAPSGCGGAPGQALCVTGADGAPAPDWLTAHISFALVALASPGEFERAAAIAGKESMRSVEKAMARLETAAPAVAPATAAAISLIDRFAEDRADFAHRVRASLGKHRSDPFKRGHKLGDGSCDPAICVSRGDLRLHTTVAQVRRRRRGHAHPQFMAATTATGASAHA